MASTLTHKLLYTPFALFLCAVFWLPAMAAPSDLEAIAQVNQTVITQKDLLWFTSHVNEDLAYPSYEQQEKTLDQLINRELLFQESVAKEISVSENDIKKKLDRLIHTLRTTHPIFRQKTGLSRDDIALEVKKDLSISKLLRKELPRLKEVTDEEASAYYQAHPEQFLIKGAVRVRHILIKVDPNADEPTKTEAREKIAAVLEQLSSGGDFAELARTYSEGPSRIKGGDVGWVYHGQKYKLFEDTAYSLDIGQISDIIETPLGYHILMVTDKKPASMLEFEKADKPLKKWLFHEKKQALIKELVNHLRATAHITIFSQQP